MRLRLAAFRTIKPDLLAHQTIQPTQVAGFNQFLDDANGTEAWQYGIGLDARLTTDLEAGFQISRLNLEEPTFLVNERFTREDRTENLLRTYLYWTVNRDLVITSEFRFDDFDGGTGALPDLPSEVETLSVPLAVRYFNPLGFFGAFGATFVHQHVTRNAEGASLPEGTDSFVIFNTAVGYCFPQRRGLVGLEVNNVFGKQFKFQDESYRQFSDELPLSRYLPERSVVARLYLNF